MQLLSLYQEGFRNLRPAALEFSPGINLILGDNAQGKSNLLEAVAYLGLASSFRNAREPELIAASGQHFYLRGQITTSQGPLRIEAAADRQRRRRWRVNEQLQTRLSQVVGLFHTVVFAPEDIWLVKAGPEQRRRYLNRQLAQNSAAYCREQLLYTHILHQRNACLKAIMFEQIPEELEIWDNQLAQAGSRILAARLQAVSALQPLAAAALSCLAPGEQLTLRYRSPLLREGPAAEEELRQRFLAELRRQRHSELLRRTSLVGPHRDDLELLLNDKPARDYASQGQQRTIGLTLKLAELELAQQSRDEYPALLLDDVFSELDNTRRAHILELVQGSTQTFITATSLSLPLNSAANFYVEGGEIYNS